jgi:toxin-antitoxin system PIN domain toxin
MRFLVDTNVLLAATARQVTDHDEARDFVEQLGRSDSPWCLSWVNVYEFLRVATHPRVFASPISWSNALGQMRGLLAHQHLELLTETERHLDVLQGVAREAGSVSGNFVHDCHIAALMKEHDVRQIVTFDTHFRRFQQIDVVRPSAH